MEIKVGDIVHLHAANFKSAHRVFTKPRLTKGGYVTFFGMRLTPEKSRTGRIVPFYLLQQLITVERRSPSLLLWDGLMHYASSDQSRQPACLRYPPEGLRDNQWTRQAILVTCPHCRSAMAWAEMKHNAKHPIPEGANPYSWLVQQSKKAKGRGMKGLAKRRAAYYAARAYWEKSSQAS